MTTPKAPTRDEARVLLNNIDLYVEDGMQPEYDAIRRYITHLEQSREAELEEAFNAGRKGKVVGTNKILCSQELQLNHSPGAGLVGFEFTHKEYADYKQRKEQA